MTRPVHGVAGQLLFALAEQWGVGGVHGTHIKFLVSQGVRHRQDELVAFGGGDEGQGNSGVVARGFNKSQNSF